MDLGLRVDEWIRLRPGRYAAKGRVLIHLMSGKPTHGKFLKLSGFRLRYGQEVCINLTVGDFWYGARAENSTSDLKIL